MPRPALPYNRLLSERGVVAAQDRLTKNQANFDAKIADKVAEIEAIRVAKSADAADFATAVEDYRTSLNDAMETATAIAAGVTADAIADSVE